MVVPRAAEFDIECRFGETERPDRRPGQPPAPPATATLGAQTATLPRQVTHIEAWMGLDVCGGG